MTARAEIYVSSNPSYDRLITIRCYDFDFQWTLVLDNDGKLDKMISAVKQKLIMCVHHVAGHVVNDNDICLIRAWIEIEEAYEAACSFTADPSGHFKYANPLAYDWFNVGLEAVPPPGQSLSLTLLNLSNYILTIPVESIAVKQLAIRNLILPICNSAWIFLDLLQLFTSNQRSCSVKIDLSTRNIETLRPLTELAIANTNSDISRLLLPDVLHL